MKKNFTGGRKYGKRKVFFLNVSCLETGNCELKLAFVECRNQSIPYMAAAARRPLVSPPGL